MARRYVRDNKGRFARVGGISSNSSVTKNKKGEDSLRGVKGSEDINSLGELIEFSQTKPPLPPDDDEFEYFYHVTRGHDSADSISKEGIVVQPSRNQTFLSKDEIRTFGFGDAYFVVRVPKGIAEESIDRVESGLQYRQWTVKNTIPTRDILRQNLGVKSNGKYLGVDESTIARWAVNTRGNKPSGKKEYEELPEKYKKWWDI